MFISCYISRDLELRASASTRFFLCALGLMVIPLCHKSGAVLLFTPMYTLLSLLGLWLGFWFSLQITSSCLHLPKTVLEIALSIRVHVVWKGHNYVIFFGFFNDDIKDNWIIPLVCPIGTAFTWAYTIAFFGCCAAYCNDCSLCSLLYGELKI